MKQILIIFHFLIINLCSYGQEKVIIDEPFTGLAMREAEVKEISSLNQLPTRIQVVVRQLLDSSLTDFVNNVFFIRGQILDLDKFYSKDSTPQVKYQFVMPKYELYFELRDTSINIKSYCIDLSLDQYGQIIRFDYPREGYSKRCDFAKGLDIKKEAVKYAVKKGYKTDKCLYNLVFNASQSLTWHISLLQKSVGDNFNYYQEHKVIVVDAKTKKIVTELNSISNGISCGK